MLEIEGWAQDHPNYSVIEISQNTEKESRSPEETCCHSDSSERPSANGGVKNSQRSKIIIKKKKTERGK